MNYQLYKGTTILKNAGHLIPEGYLKAVLKAPCIAAGYSVQAVHNETKEPTIVTGRMEAQPTIDDLKELQELFKDEPLLLSFSNFKDGDTTEDGQPYVLTAGDIPLLAFAFEGDFPGYTGAAIKNDKSETDNLANEIILPSLQKAMKYSNEDLDKFLSELRDPVFEKNLLNSASHRAFFAFLPVIGDPVHMQKDNEIGGAYDWGLVSNTHGYSETVEDQTPEPVVETKKTGWFHKTFRNEDKTETKPVETKPAADPVIVDKPAVEPKPAKTETSTAADGTVVVDGKKGKYLTMPAHLNKQEKKNWLRRHTNCGNQLPAGWNKTGFKVFVADEPIKDLKELGNANVKTVDAKATAQSVPAAGNTAKDQATAAIKDRVMSSDQKSKLSDFIKKLDTSSNEIVDPTKYQSMEAKMPNFSKQAGIDIMDAMRWSTGTLRTLFEQHKEAAFLLMLQYRLEAISRMDVKDLIGTKTETSAEPVTSSHADKAAPEYDKVGNNVKDAATPITQPATKKGLGWLAKKAA